jgi:polyferredoxin
MWSLVIVHLLMIIHVAHYYATGSTLSPLEPSEGSYSIQTGAVNAGAIFFCLLILSSLIMGRFFCGWGCHLVAYQDLARWLMCRIGITPRPVRMRLAFLLPLLAAFWLYGKPAVARWLSGTAVPVSWHLTTDDYWQTFPGPLMTAFTILVCGFLIVYFLGAKGFCTYGCPYGFFFGLADKAAKGRIRVNEKCDGSAQCTIHCTSNVDVAREVATYGMVVDPGCMKCMDCVTICPNGALYFGFTPSVSTANRSAMKAGAPRYDFTLAQEFGMAILWAICFTTFFQLYKTIPLLLAIGMSVVAAYCIALFVRLFSSSRVALQNLRLKENGKLTSSGRVSVTICTLGMLFVAHSAWMQVNLRLGTHYFELAEAVLQVPGKGREAANVAAAHEHANQSRRALARCQDLGLFHTQGLGRMMGQIARWEERHEDAIRYLQLDIAHDTVNPATWYFLAESLAATGKPGQAADAYSAVVNRSRATKDMYLTVADRLARLGRFDRQKDALAAGAAKYQADADVAMEYCKLLVRCPDPALRDIDAAIGIAETTLAKLDNQHADLLAMLAFLYAETNQLDKALATARMSVDQARQDGQEKIAAEMEVMVRHYRQRLQQKSP